ncbi:MAG: MucR family transcriptional regulator [Rhodopila sp.]|jgi:predicted transcriptional regulator
MAEEPTDTNLLGLTARIVSAHVANNPVEYRVLPVLIRDIYKTLSHIDQSPTEPAEKPQPFVPIRKSVFPDYIICLEDGKKLKMLKRHLASAYGMTPEQYRQKWGLDANYPMVAPKYAEKRSSLAKQIGLGTRKTED